jgi:hypothetical protein
MIDRLGIAAMVVLMAGPAAAKDATPPVRDAAITLAQRLFDALTAGDAGLWTRSMTDDAVVVDEFGRRQDKAEFVEQIRPLPAGFSGSIAIRAPLVREYGTAVILDCENYEEETVHGQRLVVRYVSTLTFVREGPDLKLATLHSVTLPTQPPQLAVADLRLDDYPGTYRWGPDRAHVVAVVNGRLGFTTRPGGQPTQLDPVGRDVFMDAGDERNLFIFRRGSDGRVQEVIERRKFNDLHMPRESLPPAGRGL